MDGEALTPFMWLGAILFNVVKICFAVKNTGFASGR